MAFEPTRTPIPTTTPFKLATTKTTTSRNTFDNIISSKTNLKSTTMAGTRTTVRYETTAINLRSNTSAAATTVTTTTTTTTATSKTSNITNRITTSRLDNEIYNCKTRNPSRQICQQNISNARNVVTATCGSALEILSGVRGMKDVNDGGGDERMMKKHTQMNSFITDLIRRKAFGLKSKKLMLTRNNKGYFTGYPLHVFLVLANEFCERFSFYGMKGEVFQD
ncbi:hypothetical protein HELRODRAFT_182153 [Helobdella robusta]|uniref:Uncharacterized protein n=1 Tax=Helobdella robusta TaxID=6412 RepID=T1FHU2_HELRO|nr:hypothetical protein HELRODRAFT_182153 [Helobdella robusta]ESN91181.1 hypothetical protein HELRODRAFT_182153 [Helobdella robusta]